MDLKEHVHVYSCVKIETVWGVEKKKNRVKEKFIGRCCQLQYDVSITHGGTFPL